jgi:glycolate oxidase
MEFGAVTQEVIAELRAVLGGEAVVTEREKMIDYSHDEFSQEDIAHFPDVVVKPVNTAQVSGILKLASSRRVPVTARGGGTGLVGGCVPVCGGILLSLEKMNKVLEVDTANLMAVVEAGTTLTDFYAAIESAGFFFPPHPGDESATIGGVVAANAGGSRAVKYGVARNFVRGVEAVTAGGTVLEIGGKLMKSSTGYSLLNLLIGSEGTLAIITKAVINLLPSPGLMYTLVVPYAGLEDAIATVPDILRNRIIPLAVEFIEDTPVRITEEFIDKRWPASGGAAHLMIMLEGGGEEELLKAAEKVSEICSAHNAVDVFVAEEREKQRTVLDIRSNIYEAMRSRMLEILDVCVPRASIADFVNEVHRLEPEFGTWLPVYGHAADGNVHVHIMKGRWAGGSWKEIPDWKSTYSPLRDRIHSIGKKYGGTVSGEHGIGLIKKGYMEQFLGKEQVELMRSIKRLFDPQGILNPGKVI